MEEKLLLTESVEIPPCGPFEIFDHFVKGRIYQFIKDSFWRLIPRTESTAPLRNLNIYLLREDMTIDDLKKVFEKTKKRLVPISQVHFLVKGQTEVNPRGTLVENNHSNLFFCKGTNGKIILLSIARQGKKGWSVFPVAFFGGKLTIKKDSKLFL